jgi:hypothetical protein
MNAIFVYTDDLLHITTEGNAVKINWNSIPVLSQSRVRCCLVVGFGMEPTLKWDVGCRQALLAPLLEGQKGWAASFLFGLRGRAANFKIMATLQHIREGKTTTSVIGVAAEKAMIIKHTKKKEKRKPKQIMSDEESTDQSTNTGTEGDGSTTMTTFTNPVSTVGKMRFKKMSEEIIQSLLVGMYSKQKPPICLLLENIGPSLTVRSLLVCFF